MRCPLTREAQEAFEIAAAEEEGIGGGGGDGDKEKAGKSTRSRRSIDRSLSSTDGLSLPAVYASSVRSRCVAVSVMKRGAFEWYRIVFVE